VKDSRFSENDERFIGVRGVSGLVRTADELRR
jgi:hypothetical protein